MGESAGTVTLNLDANSVKMIRELQKASKAANRTGRKIRSDMNRQFKAISNAAKGAAVAITASFGANLARDVSRAGIAFEAIQRGLKAATGSAAGAARDFEFVREEALRLGLSLESAAQQYTKLAAAAKGTALEGQRSRDIFMAVSEASRVLGLTSEQTSGALTAIEQIISKGKVSAEELRGQLGERLPGAFQIAARSIGVTTQELDNMLKRGELLAEDLLPALAQELRETFGSGVNDAANDTAAAFSRLETAIFELKVAISESGANDFLKGLADLGASSARGWTAVIEGLTQEQEILMQLQDAYEELADIRERRPSSWTTFQEEQQIGVITALQDQLEALRSEEFVTTPIEVPVAYRMASASDARAVFNEASAQLEKEFEKFDRDARRFGDRFETAEEKAAGLRRELERYRDTLSEGQIKNVEREITDILTSGIEEIDIAGIRDMYRGLEESSDEAAQSANQLGFTFASAFEDAIVQGRELSDVMKGLVQDILRIFVRSAITQPLGDALGGFFGGFKAAGGPVDGGTSYIVGEKGPELFTPSMSGYITPNDKLGGGGNTYVFQAGADVATIRAEIIPMLQRTSEATVARVRQERLEGTL